MRARILSASAGAGKTYRLAYKFVHDVISYYSTKPYLYRAILAVTFTNKATEEMKSRILKEINMLITQPDKSNYMKDLLQHTRLSQEEISRRAKHIQTSILHDYSRFTILTIDKFFQRILRAFIKELGIDLNYNIELETNNILSLSTDSLIEDIPNDSKLEEWIMAFAEEQISEGKAWDIRSSINKLGKEIFKEDNKQTILESVPKEELRNIISSAEAKTNAIKEKAKKIGNEAIAIITDAGLVPENLVGKSSGVGVIFSKIAQGDLVEPGKTLREKSSTCEGWEASGLTKAQRCQVNAIAPRLQPLAEAYCKLYDESLKLRTSLSMIKQTYRSYALLQDIYRKVNDQCNSEGVMLLPETKYILSRFVAGNDAPFIYEKMGNRFERYMIDEFQDTSAKEWYNFVPLLQNAMSQAEDESVLIVGDVKQSIYRWRGGDWRILHRGVEKSLGKDNTITEYLKFNYRSLPEVVNFNNNIIGQVIENANSTLNNELETAAKQGRLTAGAKEELTDTLLNAYASHSQTPSKSGDEEGYVRVEFYDNKSELPIIKCIESAIERGYAYKDILILCRSKDSIKDIADLLLEYKKQNDSFNIMTQDALIVGKAVINQFIIAVMRLSQNPSDNVCRAITNRFLQRDYSTTFSDEEQSFLSEISQLTPEEAFERIVQRYELYSHKKEIAYLQALHEQVITFCSSKVADIQLFLKYWDEEGADSSLSVEMNDNTIELSTIHKAKGLERKVVILPCNWSVTPHANDLVWAKPTLADDDQLAQVGRFPLMYKSDMAVTIFGDEYYRELVYSCVDNINLLYVALTRAQEELYLFIPSYKKDSKNKDEKFKENTVGKMVWERINAGAKTDDEGCTYVEYGSPITKVSTDKKLGNNILLNEYPTTLSKQALRLPENRYFEDESATPSPRSIGIMMHSILNEATNAEDIAVRIDKAFNAGKIDEQQRTELRQIIEREFEREQVKEWFSDWDMVRNENDIISSHIIGTRRPDRVMIKGSRAVVVDYKFGAEKLPSHKRQIENYMSLLSQMGYTEIEGYIWYLSIGEILKVE
ncbi:MAG: DNA helicase UvrD [Rikenellaceae bacterium]|nr:DNA helicase UvrD [Rikenellaceae bacterium]